MRHLRTIFLATASVALLASMSPAFATTTTTSDAVIDDGSLALGYPGNTNGTFGSYYSEKDSAYESDGSGSELYVNGEGDVTMGAWSDTGPGQQSSHFYLEQGNVDLAASGGTTISDTSGGFTVNGGSTLNNGATVNNGFSANNGATLYSGTGVGNRVITNGAGAGVEDTTGSNGVVVYTAGNVYAIGNGAAENLNGTTANLKNSNACGLDIAGTTTSVGCGGTAMTVDASGNEAVAGTLGVTGHSTLIGGLTGDNGAVLWSGNGVGNHIVVGPSYSGLFDPTGNYGLVVNTGGSSFLLGNGASEDLDGTTAYVVNSSARGLRVNGTATTLTGGGNGGNTSTVTLNATTASVQTQNGNGLSATNAGLVTVMGAADNSGLTIAANGTDDTLANSYSRGVGINATTTTLTGGGSGGNASTATLNATTASMKTQNGNGLSVTNAGAVTLMGAANNSGLTIAANGTDISLVNSNGHAGMTVTSTATTISGGTTSTDLTLNDAGATFGNHSTGAPVRVTGVADGTFPFDAVNFEQLALLERKLNAGVAMGSALSGMPQVDESKTFGIALGGGYYKNQGAGAIGVSFRPRSDVVMKLGVGYSNYGTTLGGGVGISW